MISRYFISINFAAFITFGLFLGMTMLISNDDNIYLDKGERIKVVIDEVRKTQEIDRSRDKPVRPETQEIPEQLVLTMDAESEINISSELTDTIKDAEALNNGPLTGLGELDGNVTPIVTPAPVYPLKMLEKGIEGYVMLKYTVTKEGRTKDIAVAHSSHKAFEKSAIKAAEKFKYKPKIIDGEAVEVTGFYNNIEFKLQNK